MNEPQGLNKIVEIKNSIIAFIVKYKSKEFLAFIDESDRYVMVHTWTLCYRNKRKKQKIAYLQANKNGKLIKLHRIILDIKNPKIKVDHIDGNTLNNCKNNLRTCSNAQNLRNRSAPTNNTSGFKGVSKNKNTGKFETYINVNNKRIHLGHFSDLIEAAKAYNEAAKKYHGEFAKLNVGVD